MQTEKKEERLARPTRAEREALKVERAKDTLAALELVAMLYRTRIIPRLFR